MNTAPEAAELLAQSPNLTAYLRMHMDRPAVKATMPAQRPGAARAA